MSQNVSDSPVATAQQPPLREVRFEYTPHFPEILQHCRASLLVSTYQAGKLGVIGVHNGKLELSFHTFEQAMGVAAGPHGIALGTRGQVWFLQSSPDIARRVEPAGKFDACYLARHSQVTGNIHIHELGWGTTHLWVVNTLFSCLSTLHDDFSFVPRWQPPFITDLEATDRCHLNGMAMHEGKPRFVTAMAETNTPGGWRPTKATSGIVMNIDSNDVVARGLSMPHSPRWFANRLWVLDSGRGRLSTVDPVSQRAEMVAQLPGYTRGLGFSGQFAFVGLSRIRETAVFGGLPIQQEVSDLKCGIGIIDLQSGRNVAAFQFHSGVEEIFDIQVLPGITCPLICGPNPGDEGAQTIWVVPPPQTIEKLDAETSHSVFAGRGAGTNFAIPGAANIMQNDPRALLQLGVKLHEQGKLQESVTAYRQALAINPNYADAYNNLGNVFQDLLQPDNAMECYRQSIRVQPNSVFAYRNLGYVLKEQGLIEDGLKLLEQAQQIEPNDVIRYVIATSLPPVYDSVEDLTNRRARLEANVDQLIADGLKIDVANNSAPTMFYAAYQGLNDRDLQKKLASLLSAPQPKLAESGRSRDGRIRIGFISRHYRNHTIGRLNLGTVRGLPRDKFEVTVISVGHHDDMLSQDFQKGADHYLALPTNLQEIRRRVAELGLDILFFSDVGMDTLTYSLCMSRMAPVQCATWGHPETTGSPVMDYFVSSKTLEIAAAQDHYSERLARLDVLNVFYYRPQPPQKKDHAYFGLDPARHIYLCFQNLFKIHPDFDEILCGILQRDPLGDIVMMEGRHETWTKMLQSRFERNLGENASRIKFLGTQAHPDFMSLNALADVSLDPIHFGGGNTTYEALAIGLPVVTLPSDFLRARITYAMYQQMGFLDCVVKSPTEYIERAVRLGTDLAYRQSIHENILATCPILFEDKQAIQQYSDFFQSIAPA